MFPKRAWFTRAWRWQFIWLGSDEWFRLTLVVGVPLVGSVVVPLGFLRPDGELTRCTWPSCPAWSFVSGGRCVTHDFDFWVERGDWS